jgi:hypothetical protein
MNTVTCLLPKLQASIAEYSANEQRIIVEINMRAMHIVSAERQNATDERRIESKTALER